MKYVDFVNNNADQECAILGAFGFGTAMIERRTGLTPGRVGYRLKKASIKRSDYRNGNSNFAKLVLKSMREVSTKELMAHLKREGVTTYGQTNLQRANGRR